ncbi:MAG: hypothetical protein ACTSWN_13240 [Promethearchaeota archaeon]
MTEIIKIIKTIDGLDMATFERALNCPGFWEKCIELPRIKITKINERAMHWELMAYILLDPLGVNKVPVDVKHDLINEEDAGFSGEGKKWRFWTENSSAVNESEGYLFFKPASSNSIKIMVQVTKVDLKSSFLDIAGLGRALVINRLKQELQKMIMKLIEYSQSGKINSILAGC